MSRCPYTVQLYRKKHVQYWHTQWMLKAGRHTVLGFNCIRCMWEVPALCLVKYCYVISQLISLITKTLSYTNDTHRSKFWWERRRWGCLLVVCLFCWTVHEIKTDLTFHIISLMSCTHSIRTTTSSFVGHHQTVSRGCASMIPVKKHNFILLSCTLVALGDNLNSDILKKSWTYIGYTRFLHVFVQIWYLLVVSITIATELEPKGPIGR